MARCLNPIWVNNPSERIEFGDPSKIQVPCGKCLNCLKRKQDEWVFRMEQELNVSSSCYFVTLTYSDDHLPLVPYGDSYLPTLSKRDVQLFVKRLRKRQGDNRIRYFICGEYGAHNHRPHYHAVLFNLSPALTDPLILDNIWQNGFTQCGSISIGGMSYVAKYCCKLDQSNLLNVQLPEFSLKSSHPPLGINFLTPSMDDYILANGTQIKRNGYFQSIPRIYRKKVMIHSDLREMVNIGVDQYFDNGREYFQYKQHLYERAKRKFKEKNKL